MRNIRSMPIGGRPLPAWDRTARSARTAPTTEPRAPSRKETLPAVSSWRSDQIPPLPASTASSPNPCAPTHPAKHYTTIIVAGFCRGSLTGGDRAPDLDPLAPNRTASSISYLEIPDAPQHRRAYRWNHDLEEATTA